MPDKPRKPRVTRKASPGRSKKAKAKPAPPVAATHLESPLHSPLIREAGLSPAVVGPVNLSPGAPPFESSDPQLVVAGIAQPGVYTFLVTVVDDLGVVSKPARFSVQVKPVPPVIG